MKYIITEDKHKRLIKKLAIERLNELYADFEEVKLSDGIYDNIYFERDGKCYLFLDFKKGYLHVSNDVWNDIENSFDLTEEEIKKIIKEWMYDAYHYKSIIPVKGSY